MNIIYLGCSGFPYGMAEIERQKLIAKSLVNIGDHVTVINRVGIHRPDQQPVPVQGTYEGIDFVYASGTSLRVSGLKNKIYRRLYGFFNEFRIISRMNKKGKIDAAIISSMSFYTVFYYAFLSKIFSFKVILNYVEFGSSIQASFKGRVNNYLFDKFAVKYSDIVLPISQFLADWSLKIDKRKPILKIPSICDFDKFPPVKEATSDKYFLFCGSGFYFEVINFIISSYNKVSNKEYKLVLIVNASPSQKVAIDDEIAKSPKKDLIIYRSNLPYQELVENYQLASALLIPLRNTKQDIARFPHKVAEYTASKSPIVTTSIGEIPYYFRDEKDALIAESYDTDAFSRKMKYIIDHPEESKQIGLNGHETGKICFDYKPYGQKIRDCIKKS